jgi:hypothetical protein
MKILNHASRFTFLTLLTLALVACGNNTGNKGNNTSSNVGPQAITNGQTLDTATTHWTAQSGQPCSGYGLEIELTVGDSGFKSIIYDTNMTPHEQTGNWIPSANGASATMSYSLSPGSWTVISLINIAGSTSSAGFVSGVNWNGYSGPTQAANTCVFNLASGGL